MFDLHRNFKSSISINDLVLLGVKKQGLTISVRKLDVSLCNEMAPFEMDVEVDTLLKHMLMDAEAEKSTLLPWPDERAWVNLQRQKLGIHEQQATFVSMLDGLWGLITKWLGHKTPEFLLQLSEKSKTAGKTFGYTLEPAIVVVKKLDVEHFKDNVFVFPHVLASLDRMTHASSAIMHSRFIASPTEQEKAGSLHANLEHAITLEAFDNLPEDLQHDLRQAVEQMQTIICMYTSIATMAVTMRRIERHFTNEDTTEKAIN